jgi:hypothetical protein
MSKFRFFGTESTLPGGKALTQYGQVVDMVEEEANALIAAFPSGLLLPEDLWEKIGITAEELAEYPSVTIHGAAPEAFLAKTRAVRVAFHEYRESLLAAASPPSAPAGGFGKPPAQAGE